MINNVTKLDLDAFYSVIRAHNAEETTISEIGIDSILTTPGHCTADDLKEAARYLIAALERDSGAWLDFQVYGAANGGLKGEFKAEILITCGGPTVRIDYESCYDCLRFEYSSAGACVSVDIDTDKFSAGGELAEKIRECAEGYLCH